MKRRDSSRENNGEGMSERDPMRESTMYFLKQVFNKNADEDDYFKSLKRGSQITTDDDEDESINTPMSLLKNRRKNTMPTSLKENESPT